MKEEKRKDNDVLIARKERLSLGENLRRGFGKTQGKQAEASRRHALLT